MNKTLFRTVILTGLCMAVLQIKAFSFTYVLGESLNSYSTQAQPAKGASYTDAVYNTTVTRFTNSASEHGSGWGSVTEYSTYSPESSDKNWVVIEGISSLSNSSGYYLYTGAGVYSGGLSTYIQSWNGQEPEVRWDNSGSHPSWLYYRKNMQLRYYDVSAKTDNLVRDFSADFPSYSGYYIFNGDEGNCSEDSRYWSFMVGNSNSNIPITFTYDKTLNKVIASHSTGGHAPNNVFMSKSGNYIYVAYAGSGAGGEYDGPHCYKNDYTSNVKICSDIPHAVPAYDAQGNEVIFFMQSTPSYADYVQFVRCDTGAAYPLYSQASLGWDSSNALHTSPGLAKKGWGFISTYSVGSGHTSDKWDYNQIFAFELDETKTSVSSTKPRIWRVSFTQNFPNSSYYYNQPNAAITNDGQRIYWGADWRDTATSKMEVYRIDLPANWYSDLGGTTQPPPPVDTTPAAPSGLYAVALSTGSIGLTWADNSNNETGFKIERGLNTGSYSQIAVTGANVTAYNNSGLSYATTYYYRVRATNAIGDSSYSNSALALTQASTVNAPANLTVTAVSTGSINLAWADNANNEIGYIIERGPGINSFAQIVIIGANSAGYSDGNLSLGTTYYYRVKAYNSFADSAYSNVAVGVTQAATIVNAPTNLSLTVISSGSIALSWKDNSNNETGFKIERGPDLNSFAQISIAGANVSGYTDTGLSYGTTYYYRLRAFNATVNSPYSNSAFAATQPYILPAPSNLSAEALSRSSIRLSWKDNSADETGFKLDRMQGYNGSFAQCAALNANTISFTDNNLAQRTLYTYRIKAYNSSAESSYSNTISVQTRFGGWRSPDEAAVTLANVSEGEIKIVGPPEGKGIINPSKGDTARIYFKGSGVGKFEARIFTLTGRQVWDSVQDNVSEGMFEWAPTDMPSGGYVAYVNGPGLKAKKKLAIIK